MTRQVLITGFAPDSRKQSPIWSRRQRSEFEVWGFNNDHQQMEHAQRWFEMHDLNVYAEAAVDDVKADDDYLERLHKGLGIPVYMLKSHDDIPGSIAYPIQTITKEFGEYFTNSISYMIALAIHEGVDEIHLYGIDMAREHEHAWERPSIEYFLGFARGAGIKVVIPETSDLLKCLGLYGYVDSYEIEAALRERREDLRASAQSYQRAADRQQGAADDIEFWLRRTVLPDDRSFQANATSAKAKSRKAWLLKRQAQYLREYRLAIDL